ncbi:MAG: threonine dehydratase [Heteroscytonema crispum UTEX LB 1556]
MVVSNFKEGAAMLRLTQIIRNLYIRFEGFVSVFWKNLANFVRNFFVFFARLFGLISSDYFLESDQAQGIKRTEAKQPIEAKQDTTPETTATTRRLQNAKMDYYLNMAREIKKN